MIITRVKDFVAISQYNVYVDRLEQEKHSSIAHLGLMSHICNVENNIHLPCDTYINRKSISPIATVGV